MKHDSRPIYLPKSTDLERSRHIGRVVEALEDLPLDHAWKVEIIEAKSERSLKQNKALFGLAYPLICDVTGYEKEDIHEELLKRHFGVKLKKVPRCRDYPEGLREVPLRTTTTDEHGRRSVLGKIAFAEFFAFVQRFGAEHLNVIIPDPDASLAAHEFEEKAA
jgi:hypothetical protein